MRVRLVFLGFAIGILRCSVLLCLLRFAVLWLGRQVGLRIRWLRLRILRLGLCRLLRFCGQESGAFLRGSGRFFGVLLLSIIGFGATRLGELFRLGAGLFPG